MVRSTHLPVFPSGPDDVHPETWTETGASIRARFSLYRLFLRTAARLNNLFCLGGSLDPERGPRPPRSHSGGAAWNKRKALLLFVRRPPLDAGGGREALVCDALLPYGRRGVQTAGPVFRTTPAHPRFGLRDDGAGVISERR